MNANKRRILDIEFENSFLKKEVKRLMLEMELINNGRFLIERDLDKEGDTLQWFVTERKAEFLMPCPLSPGKWEMTYHTTPFDTKKECWEYIRKRRREIKKAATHIE